MGSTRRRTRSWNNQDGRWDYIITHAAPNHIVDLLSGGTYGYDPLTNFLEGVRQKTKFHYWLFGHYHDNRIFEEKYVLLWEQIVKVL